MKILVVDDDEVSRLILQKMLRNWGHEVACSDDGRAAWERLSVENYEVVVSDWMMPQMDGLELCRKIRGLNRSPYCYIILFTAVSRTENLIRGIEAGADDYLSKPVNQDDLRARLLVASRILGLRSDIASLRALLPMCAWCKSIKTEGDRWQSVDSYIEGHTSNDLTHSICPECLKKQLEELSETL